MRIEHCFLDLIRRVLFIPMVLESIFFVMLPAINQLVVHMYINITAFYMFIDITISGTELILYFGL